MALKPICLYIDPPSYETRPDNSRQQGLLMKQISGKNETSIREIRPTNS